MTEEAPRKKELTDEEEILFFIQLGFRFYSTVLRGHVLGHRRPLSAARDYLRVESLEGMDREASEFLVDVARMGRAGGLSLEELHRKWADVAEWHPSGKSHGRLPLSEDQKKKP